MTAIPELPDLVGEVILEGLAGPRDPLRQIGEAERLAGELTHLGERLVGFFVEQARADGLSWADIGAPRGLSRQGAQQKYAPLLSHLAVADLVEAGTLRQFGEAALAALRRAEDHAARLGRDAVDSGDLLLGVLEDDGNVAVAAIRELGVDPDVLRAELARSEEGLGSATGGAVRAAGAETAGVVAGAEGAAGAGHTAWASGGAEPQGTGRAGRPGAGAGDRSEQGAVAFAPSGDRKVGERTNAVPLSMEARRAIDGAVAEARGHLAGPAHLLLGMLRNPGGRAGRILGAYGVTKSSAMGAILAVGSRRSMEQG